MPGQSFPLQLATLSFYYAARPRSARRTPKETSAKAEESAATVLRPWYVLGPGHRWPYALVPVYWLLQQFPATREASQRLGLVTHAPMIAALRRAIERTPHGVEIMDVLAIRAAGS